MPHVDCYNFCGINLHNVSCILNCIARKTKLASVSGRCKSHHLKVAHQNLSANSAHRKKLAITFISVSSH